MVLLRTVKFDSNYVYSVLRTLGISSGIQNVSLTSASEKLDMLSFVLFFKVVDSSGISVVFQHW